MVVSKSRALALYMATREIAQPSHTKPGRFRILSWNWRSHTQHGTAV